MAPSVFHNLRTIILRYLYKRRMFKRRKMVRRIHMHFIKKELYKKVRTKLHYVRNCVIAAQKFMIWSVKLKRLHFRQLTYVWDLYIKQMCEGKAKKKDLMADVKNAKIESTLTKQREKIAKESKELGANRKTNTSTTKLVTDKYAKSKFEVMLDFM